MTGQIPRVLFSHAKTNPSLIVTLITMIAYDCPAAMTARLPQPVWSVRVLLRDRIPPKRPHRCYRGPPLNREQALLAQWDE